MAITAIGSTLRDATPGQASIVDSVELDRGIVRLRGIEAGNAIALAVFDSDDDRHTTTQTKLNIAFSGVFDSDVIINGDLTVNGDQTTINSTTHVIADNKIVINDGETGAGVVTLGTKAGLIVDRGSEPDVEWCWDETRDIWTSFGTLLGDFADPTLGIHVGDRDYNDARYLQNVVEDSSPQLGGNLDINGWDVTDGTDFKWDSANSRLSVGTGENTATVNGTTRGITINAHSGSGNLINLASHRHSNNAVVSPFFFGGRTRGTEASPLIVTNDDDIYNFVFAGWDGTDYAHAAIIAVEVDGTPGTDDMPGRIVFMTSADGSQTPTEALRLDSNQDATFAGDIIIAGLVDGVDISAHAGAGGPVHADATVSVSGFLSAADKVLIGNALQNVVEDTSPVLGGNLVLNSFDLYSVDGVILSFDSGAETPTNNLEVANANSGGAVVVRSVGTDTNIDLDISAKGTGTVNLGNAGVTIGGGAVMTSVLTATDSLAFGSLDAGEIFELVIAVPGAVVGASVSLGLPAVLAPGIMFNAYVDSAGSVTVRAANVSDLAEIVLSETYRVTVFNF